MKLVLGIYLFLGFLILVLVELSWGHLEKEPDLELTDLIRSGIVLLWPALVLGIFCKLLKEK